MSIMLSTGTLNDKRLTFSVVLNYNKLKFSNQSYVSQSAGYMQMSRPRMRSPRSANQNFKGLPTGASKAQGKGKRVRAR